MLLLKFFVDDTNWHTDFMEFIRSIYVLISRFMMTSTKNFKGPTNIRF
jgi:hypothetical protein